MKKIFCLVFSMILLISVSVPSFAADTVVPGVTATAYIVIDAQTGQVLVQKNAQKTNFPASITKIMTMALAIEKSGGNLDQPIIVSKEATQIPRGSSHIALLEGEQASLRDILMATLLRSANDGANVLAEFASGSIEAFVQDMNKKAAEIGCEGTQFNNAHGFHDPQHYVTAADMAKITAWAYTVPGFEEFFANYEYRMPANNMQPERPLGTDNLMLVTSKYEYAGTLGGKSGFTNEARYTMVEVAQREGRRLISVALGSSGRYERFSDSIALLDYCFENFRTFTIDGAAFAPQKAKVYGGADKSIGEVTVNVPSITIQLPVGVSQSDLQVEYNIPEKYIIGRPFDAQCTISLKSQGSDISSTLATVDMVTGSLGEVLARNTGAITPINTLLTGKNGANIWTILLSGFALCAIALIGSRIAYVAFIKSQRRRRKMERMRLMYLDATVGPSITANAARGQTVQRRNAYVQHPAQTRIPHRPSPSYNKNSGAVNTKTLHVVIGGAQPQQRQIGR